MNELLPNIFAIDVSGFCKKAVIKAQKVHVYDEEDIELRAPYDLPPGSYEIMFTTKGVSEDQAASIVQRDRGGFFGNVEGYKEYFKPGDWSMDHEPFKSAIRSLWSLLESKGLTAGNYLIIRKVEG